MSSLIKFQQQKYTMRTLIRRNNRNEPCKSPSPDLAAKNIIKNTTIEVEDIRSKMRKAEERQIRFDLQSSISQIAPSEHPSNLDHKYRQIMEEFARLKHQNKLLADQNRLLNQENQRLNLQEERNKNISQLQSVLLSKNDSEALREKVLLLDDEKKRLEKQLVTQRQKSEQSFRNMDKLRMELLLLRGEIGAGVGSTGPGEQQSRFMLLSNSILADYQQRMGKRLQQLNFRINRIQMMQKIIKEQHSRITAQSRVNKTPSSVKSNWANNTTLKPDSRYKEQPHTQQRSERDTPLPLSSSPIERHYKMDQSVIQRLQQENLSLAQELRLRQSQIQRMKIQKEKMGAILHDLELERKALKISTPKFNTDTQTFKKFNIEEGHSQGQIEQLKRQKQFIRQEMTALQGSIAIERREFVTKIDYLQKVIKFYKQKQAQKCQRCAQKDEEITSLKDAFKKLQQRFEGNLGDLQRKFQTEIQDYQRKLQHSESAGSERFRSLQDEYQRSRQVSGQLVGQLGNYKMMLQYIKDKIHLEPIAKLLNENIGIYSQVQSTSCQERQDYDRSIASFRQQALQKDQQIIALQTQLQLKTKEVELLRQQVQKLRQVNLQLQDNSLNVLRSNIKFMGRDRASKSKTFQSNNQKIIQLVQSGQSKLDILYQKIKNTLNYDLVHHRHS